MNKEKLENHSSKSACIYCGSKDVWVNIATIDGDWFNCNICGASWHGIYDSKIHKEFFTYWRTGVPTINCPKGEGGTWVIEKQRRNTIGYNK